MKMSFERSQPVPGTSKDVLAALLEARTGQRIGTCGGWRVDTALKNVLTAHGIESTEALVAKLMLPQQERLADAVADALLNQETFFFRDAPVFDQIARAVEDIRVAGRRPRIWSAACSTGQEPLSLAMLFAEREIEVDIIATDISAAAIARARAARYSHFEIQRGLAIGRLINWFDQRDEDWIAKPSLTRHIRFWRQNLVADAPPAGLFDVVLCRNVLLYFGPDVRRQVFARLATALRPGGVLILGAGETVIGQTDQFAPSPCLRGFYQRTTA